MSELTRATECTFIRPRENVAATARKKLCAPQAAIDKSRSMSTNQLGLRRVRLRRMKFVREQFFLAATAQNLKRLVRFLAQTPKQPLPATTRSEERRVG